MKNKLMLSVCAFLLLACSNDNDCCVNIDTSVSIKFLNEAGENLLGRAGGLNESDITIYYRIDNEWIEYFEGNLDYPKGISTVEGQDGPYLIVFPSNVIVADNYSETKIEFFEAGSDILKTEIDKSTSNQMVTKVWYNGELKWEGSESKRVIEIVK